MAKYECPCGYVYDPEDGDYENQVDAGTDFKDLPGEWICPKCDSEQEYFEELDD
jgi:rubredoxin